MQHRTERVSTFEDIRLNRIAMSTRYYTRLWGIADERCSHMPTWKNEGGTALIIYKTLNPLVNVLVAHCHSLHIWFMNKMREVRG